MPPASRLNVALAAAALVCGLLFSESTARAADQTATERPPLTRIDVLGFGGTSNLPLWLAQDTGLFARNGLDVVLTRAQGPAAQMVEVMSGRYPVFIASFDTIVAYQEGQGTATLPQTPDMFAFLGLHHGLNSLVVKPELRTYQDLRGRVMGVDSLASGYAFVLYELLGRNDLQRGEDYKIVPLGGPAERFAALKSGRIDGTLLSAPNDDEAREQGFLVLAEPSDLTGGYQGAVYGTRRHWANAHKREMMALTRSLIAAHRAVHTDKLGAIAVLRKRFPQLTEERADLVYRGLVDEKGGLSKAGEISVPGVKTVLRLRSEMGQPAKTLTDPYRYIDLSYYRQLSGE